MIFCNLKGGLCNMLFQIAAVKSFAIDSNQDCSFPNLIDHYDVMDDDKIHIPNLKHSSEYHQIFKELNVIKPSINLPIINFPFHYTTIDKPDGDYIIDGFFQSEKYFKHNRDNILDFIKMPKVVDETIKTKFKIAA